MSKHKTSVFYSFVAFATLSLVSLYRQTNSISTFNNSLRPVIVYFVYLLLLGGWSYSIAHRFVQKSMKKFLYGEIFIMLLWMSVRFLQDKILYKNIFFMRQSGYFIVIPIVFIPLLGFYAALGLGKGEDYRIDRKWRCLIIPSAVFSVLMLTNEVHFLVFQYYMEGDGMNLKFYPNIGVYLIALWALSLEIAKIVLIFKKGYNNKHSSFPRYLPFICAVFMLLYTIPYFLSSFFVSKELMEFSVGLFFFEAVTWECCVVADMIAVNTGYSEMFYHSTMGLQIFDENRELLVKSITANKLSIEELQELEKDKYLEIMNHIEMHLHPIQDVYLVWQKDVSKIKTSILELERMSKELEQDAVLLREEIWTKTEEVKTQVKNELYDRFTKEVGTQLKFMSELLENQEGLSDIDVFQRLNVIGIYVKRRCNLRLIEQELGMISASDIKLSIEDFARGLRETGICVNMFWIEKPMDSELFLFIFDVLEFLVEYEDFQMKTMEISNMMSGVLLCIQNAKTVSSLPIEMIESKNEGKYKSVWSTMQNGYQLEISKRGI